MAQPLTGSSFAAAMASAKAGDGSGFEQLFAWLAPDIARFITARAADDPDGVTNDAFARAFRQLNRFDGTSASFRAWMFAIARSQLISYERAGGRGRSLSLDGNGPLGGVTAPVPAADEFTSNRLVPILARLTDEQRDVVLLRLIGGLSLKQISIILGQPMVAVGVLHRQSLRRLQDEVLAASARSGADPTQLAALALTEDQLEDLIAGGGQTESPSGNPVVDFVASVRTAPASNGPTPSLELGRFFGVMTGDETTLRPQLGWPPDSERVGPRARVEPPYPSPGGSWQPPRRLSDSAEGGPLVAAAPTGSSLGAAPAIDDGFDETPMLLVRRPPRVSNAAAAPFDVLYELIRPTVSKGLTVVALLALLVAAGPALGLFDLPFVGRSGVENRATEITTTSLAAAGDPAAPEADESNSFGAGGSDLGSPGSATSTTVPTTAAPTTQAPTTTRAPATTRPATTRPPTTASTTTTTEPTTTSTTVTTTTIPTTTTTIPTTTTTELTTTTSTTVVSSTTTIQPTTTRPTTTRPTTSRPTTTRLTTTRPTTSSTTTQTFPSSSTLAPGPGD